MLRGRLSARKDQWYARPDWSRLSVRGPCPFLRWSLVCSAGSLGPTWVRKHLEDSLHYPYLAGLAGLLARRDRRTRDHWGGRAVARPDGLVSLSLQFDEWAERRGGTSPVWLCHAPAEPHPNAQSAKVQRQAYQDSLGDTDLQLRGRHAPRPRMQTTYAQDTRRIRAPAAVGRTAAHFHGQTPTPNAIGNKRNTEWIVVGINQGSRSPARQEQQRKRGSRLGGWESARASEHSFILGLWPARPASG